MIDPYVKISIQGIAADRQSATTRVVPNNGFHPVWNDSNNDTFVRLFVFARRSWCALDLHALLPSMLTLLILLTPTRLVQEFTVLEPSVALIEFHLWVGRHAGSAVLFFFFFFFFFFDLV